MKKAADSQRSLLKTWKLPEEKEDNGNDMVILTSRPNAPRLNFELRTGQKGKEGQTGKSIYRKQDSKKGRR